MYYLILRALNWFYYLSIHDEVFSIDLLADIPLGSNFTYFIVQRLSDLKYSALLFVFNTI